MAEWSLDIDKWCGTQKEKVVEVKKRFAFMLYSSIVKKTPFDTGRARGNWNISVGSPDLTTSDTKDPKFKNPKSIPAGADDQPIYICNNLPYIKTLEFGGYPSPVEKGTWVKKGKNGPSHYEIRSENGFSKQAPQGMVGVTVANAETYLKKAMNDVNNGK